ncbi:hypothetical protein B7463_g11169, partial [Scytalidium lignicola]
MVAIYANSFLTINASASPESEGGRFVKRSSLASTTCKFRPSDSSGDIYVTEYIDEVPFSKSSQDHTGTRAWCLQEIVLPHRVVFYGRKMIGWLCDSKRISQRDGEMGIAPGLRMENMQGKDLHLQRWAFIVMNYIARKLTYDREKLVAIYGLAAHIKVVLEDEYHAGIWRNDMIDGLL